MFLRRHLISRLYRNSDPDADSGGGGIDTAPPAGADPAAGTPDVAGGTPDVAGGMLEAMFGQKPAAPSAAETAEAAATGKTVQQLRDERGRFAGKAPDSQQPVQGQPDPTKAPKPGEKPEHQMPEGLAPKAQERFQALVSSNKDLTAKVVEWEPAVLAAQGLQQTFHDNGVTREQFDQAMEVVGLMNKGDLRGALKVLEEQRALISMHLGEPLAGADALAQFPDLRQDVDNMLLTEQRALEIARGRAMEQGRQQQAQRTQQQRQQQEQQAQTQQHAQTARDNGLKAVDALCGNLQKTDMDFARIEPLLLKEIEGGLLQDVPPTRWAALVEKTYALIKQTAAQTRGSFPTTGVLRPTGTGESVRQAPKTMHEAMWGPKT